MTKKTKRNEKYGLFKVLYKPDAKKEDKRAAEQVFLYTLALSKRTGIPLSDFTCAYFDDRNYFQFSPLPKEAAPK